MALTAANYLAQLFDLQPTGDAWSREPQRLWSQLLASIAEEFARVDGRADALLAEADPRTMAEMFPDYERVLGLPDACISAIAGAQTPAQRRQAVVSKLMSDGGQDAAYFVALAAALGYAISITEYDAHTVEDDVDAPIYGEAWNYAWQVNAPLASVTYQTVDDDVDQPLASWGNGLLECVINKVKPGHSVVLYSYT